MTNKRRALRARRFPERHTMKQTRRSAALKSAFPHTVPVLTGYLCLGTAFGVLMAANGYGVGWALLTSIICFAGSGQFVAASMMVAAFDPLAALVLSLMINARHIFYGLSILEKYRGLGRVRPFLIFGLTDETFSMVSTLDVPEGIDHSRFYFWITFVPYLYWLSGSVLGNLAGNLFSFDSTGIDFVLTALFVVLFLEQWKKKENRPAGIIGLVCTAAALLVFGADNLIIPAMVLILAVLLGGRKRLCA